MKAKIFFVFTFFFFVNSFTISGRDPKELLATAIIRGSAYCGELKSAPFKFSCNEHIVLSKDKIIMKIGLNNKPERQKFNINYFFDYRLVNKNGLFREERKLIRAEGGDINQNPMDLILFLSERVAYAPILILDKNRVKEFTFILLAGCPDEENEFIKIRVVPRDQEKWIFNSIDIEVDSNSYAVRRLKATLSNIRGYNVLRRIAAYYQSKLILTCEVTFNENFHGLFFPSEVIISEKYRGGPQIPLYVGPLGWERTRTTFKYTDYKFLYSGE